MVEGTGERRKTRQTTTPFMLANSDSIVGRRYAVLRWIIDWMGKSHRTAPGVWRSQNLLRVLARGWIVLRVYNGVRRYSFGTGGSICHSSLGIVVRIRNPSSRSKSSREAVPDKCSKDEQSKPECDHWMDVERRTCIRDLCSLRGVSLTFRCLSILSMSAPCCPNQCGRPVGATLRVWLISTAREGDAGTDETPGRAYL
jgi:hypothetical protein